MPKQRVFSVSKSYDNLDIFKFPTSGQDCTHPAFWPAAPLRRTSVLPQAKPRRRGGSAAPSIEIPKGGAALRAAEPTKKDICKADVLFCGARGGSRTRTPLRALAPEASESTNSTTRASGAVLMYRSERMRFYHRNLSLSTGFEKIFYPTKHFFTAAPHRRYSSARVRAAKAAPESSSPRSW